MAAGDGAAASETGNTQVSGGPYGGTTHDQYTRNEMGDVQVGG